jgi:NADH dehydrogenase
MQGLVTVFGGSGFVGGQVVRALAKRGLRVRVAVRRPNLAYRMRMAGDVGQIEIVQANVRNPASVGRALDGAEACVNLVGVFYEHGRQGFQAVHVMGSRHVAEAAAARGIASYVHMSGIGADADSPSKYVRTRALGEAEALKAAPSAVILRPSVIFGPEDRLFNTLARMAVLSPVIPLPGGGQARFAPVCVTDVAEAVAAAVVDPATAGRVYELGGPATYSWRELVEFTLRQIQRRRALVALPFKLAELIGKVGEAQGRYLPIPPLLTTDQVELLRRDNLPDPALPGIADLGVGPLSTIEAVAPTYLYRYRKGGQFAEPAEVVSGSAA